MWRIGLVLVWVLRRLGIGGSDRVVLLPEATQRFLRDAESVEVFSLAGVAEGDGPFLGADVNGSVVVADRRTRRRLIDRILLANRYNLGSMLCLDAEYGVRVRSGATTVDLTFCFHCSMVWLSGSVEHRGTGTVAAYPLPLLKKILARAGVPLPQRSSQTDTRGD